MPRPISKPLAIQVAGRCCWTYSPGKIPRPVGVPIISIADGSSLTRSPFRLVYSIPEGWSGDPDSVRTVNTLVRPGDRYGRPWRFGGPHEKGPRGYSDHFPITVRLSVN